MKEKKFTDSQYDIVQIIAITLHLVGSPRMLACCGKIPNYQYHLSFNRLRPIAEIRFYHVYFDNKY
jgi:hypothetical protein